MGEYVPGPNQDVVRGAPPQGGAPEDAPTDEPTDLDQMTKAQLLEYAAENEVEADESMTKAQIRAAINGDD